jgi:hypothetical protein
MSKFDFRSGDPLDASLGLIMRLNKLWYEVDDAASVSNFSKWNTKLDCVFRNLLYKEPLYVEFAEDRKVITCKLGRLDENLYNYLNKAVKEASNKYAKAKTKTEYETAKEELYNALSLKDIGLRKFMFQLKLYLKQGDGNPANAMWGG